ncbi:MAG: (2Fe-2S)-binding protein [Candidatus Angelobacter sp.]
MPKTLVQLQVNGVDETVAAWPMQRLLDVLRDDLKMTGVKEGCGEGECGACAVLFNGMLVNSCLVPVCQADGARITTIEGLIVDGEIHPVQRAFIDHGGTQCGFCTPGMIMAVVSLLRENPTPSDADIRRAIAGNLCRCTGYVGVVKSALEAQQAAGQVERESVR